MKEVLYLNTAKIFGYIRVSSKDQNLDRQIDSLKQYVPDERDIYSDKLSGKDFNRPAYQTLKSMLRPGDMLYIHEMERLGRNKKEVMEELRFFKEHDVVIRILNLPTTLLDFSQYDSKLQKMLMEMVNNVLIEVLATMAEAERDNIRKRQKEGIAVAKAKGVYRGRHQKAKPYNWKELVEKYQSREIRSVSELMRIAGCSRPTIYNWLKESGVAIQPLKWKPYQKKL